MCIGLTSAPARSRDAAAGALGTGAGKGSGSGSRFNLGSGSGLGSVLGSVFGSLPAGTGAGRWGGAPSVWVTWGRAGVCCVGNAPSLCRSQSARASGDSEVSQPALASSCAQATCPFLQARANAVSAVCASRCGSGWPLIFAAGGGRALTTWWRYLSGWAPAASNCRILPRSSSHAQSKSWASSAV
jgi:hypothetical protein